MGDEDQTSCAEKRQVKMLIFLKGEYTIRSLRNTPLLSSGHFGLKTRLDGPKQRTQKSRDGVRFRFCLSLGKLK